MPARSTSLPNRSANSDHFFAVAGWLILVAMIFDMLDGYVARLSKTASKFGGELDSLCDAISFGVAPAFLLLKMGPGWDRPLFTNCWRASRPCTWSAPYCAWPGSTSTTRPIRPATSAFAACPLPGAAGCMASLAILRGGFADKLAEVWTVVGAEQTHALVLKFVEVFSPIGALVVALLMVSAVPYPHVTKQILRGRRHLGHLIQVLLAVALIVAIRELALFLMFWGYALALPLRYLLQKKLRPDQVPAPDALPRL